jgi:hypothetical protein
VDFRRHSLQPGSHALLSPSNYHWVNYDEDKLDRVYFTQLAARRGNDLHALACEMIRLGVKLPEDQKTLSMYVNDAIGYRMTPEQVLYYSENCFGTTDAISFRANVLRVSDYKSGVSSTSFSQLDIYVALFCHEYRFSPFDIKIEERIYQNDEVRLVEPDPVHITYVMDRIVTLDKRIKTLKEEVS